MSANEKKRKRVAVIGATGSVGSSVMSVCRAHRDEIEVVSLAARKPSKKLTDLAEEFDIKTLCVFDTDGSEGLIDAASSPYVDHVVFASSGTAAIPALQAALRAGKEVSLANKESIVAAGPWVMPLVSHPDQLRPLDSEHNAVWQCIHGECGGVRSILLTASGGPFRDWTFERMKTVTPEMAVRHPVWAMGAKITVDSATLMNKGIELIEAMFLFGLEPHQVDAVVSPGSFVHGMVEFEDGSLKMLAAEPDMRLPAASCLFWPERRFPAPDFKRPLTAPRTITFEQPDHERFPAMRIAKEVMRRKGPYPAAMIGADESAVNGFLNGRIGFTDIARVVEETLSSCSHGEPRTLEDAIDILEWSRRRADELCGAKA